MWNQVPQNQDVPITRAVFDRGGYQLHDNAGETIVVPDAQNNQCPLKFARSTNGRMYLVNEGCSPVLYMPADGDLQNGTVPRARWYPFVHGYNPSHPVYMSVAPSVESYDHMGWYPGMACYGGYECDNYNDPDVSFGDDIGLIFVIGGHDYNGWGPYYSYYGHHRTNYHTAYYNPQVYGWAGRPRSANAFASGQRMWAHHTMYSGASQHRTMAAVSGARVFRGASPAFRGKSVRAIGHDASHARVFRGASPAFRGKTVRFAHSSGTRTFRTAASHSFRGTTARTVEHRSTSARSYRSAGRSADRSAHTAEYRTRTQSPRSYSHPASNERQFGGGHQSGGGRSDSGGGGHQSGGGRQFGGGGGHQSGGRGLWGGGGGHESGGRGPSGGGDDRRRG
jgi:hypothetical protein